MSSIVLGIAALVAMYSFGYNLQHDIDKEAKTLTGADLTVEANHEISPGIDLLLDSTGGERAAERSFASMILFVKSGGTRLVQIRAMEGRYPFYGSIQTSPIDAAKDFQEGRNALVDKTLMLQYNAQVGDSVRIGESTFVISGRVNKAPGKTGFSTAVAPGVFIPLRYLEETGLSQKGSRISYRYYVKYAAGTDMESVLNKIGPRIESAGMDIDTVESAKRNTGRSFADFTQFLTLISFAALLLGCIGVASSVHIYIREKIHSVAILRCLGVTGSQAFFIYLIQIIGIGLLSSMAGAAIGTGLQFLLPVVLKDLLPIDVNMQISWAAVGGGTVAGLFISVLFALLPLVSVRNISPLNTLRIHIEEGPVPRDPLKWLIYLLTVAFILIFSRMQMGGWQQATVFTLCTIGVFAILGGTALLLMAVVKKSFRESWSYLWRQGFANLYRPNNQTVLLVIAIGLGTFFICTLYFVQNMLVDRVTLSSSNNQPNMILFDIQDDQKEQVAALTRSYHLPVIQEVPIVNMRIEKINGLSATDAREDSAAPIPARAFEGELRVTYRDTITSSEKVVEGSWPVIKNGGNHVYISLEEGYARRIRVGIGDTILFNVQGAIVPAIVGSLRQVDWARVQTNFRVIFPTGVLETAPKFHVLVTRVPSNEVSARFQQALVNAFPTISVIDLGLILSVMDDILDKIGFIIRFMGGFGIGTGLVVLIASILISKYQRVQENVLLRTLGASRRQVLAITVLEYFFLGSLAAFTGIFLSLAGSWALARFSFEMPFAPAVWPMILIFLSVSLLTVLIGLLNSRDVLNSPPLEIWRKEN